MNTYEYSCNYCNYFIETSGPWPFDKTKAQVPGDKEDMKTFPKHINGLLAEVYCPTCDKSKKYRIVEYESPLKALDDIWMKSNPKKIKMTCYKCKKPVFLVMPPGKVKCPRCKKGTFEVYKIEEDSAFVSPVPPPRKPLQVRQDGKSIHIPKPTVVIDSAEHMGYKFDRFTNWFSGTVRKRLPIGDYTLIGFEDEIIIERKTIPDLVNSVIQERKEFISKCDRLSHFKKKCLVIEGSLASLKTPYDESRAHPNAVIGSIIAAQERWHIPLYFLDNYILAEEFVASMLSKYHAYRWLEDNGYRRCIIEGDI